MLQAKKRLILPPLKQWRRELIAMGLKEIPIDGESGILANELVNFHSDPADRLIIATAVANNALLVTADQRILKWQGNLERMDAAE